MTPADLGNVPLLDLFRREVESQAGVLTEGLLALERGNAIADHLEAGMRAAHSLKGAARIVGVNAGVRIAGAIEDCFVGAQQGRITFDGARIDSLLEAVDLLKRIAGTPEPELPAWDAQKLVEIDAAVAGLEHIVDGHAPDAGAAVEYTPRSRKDDADTSDRMLRVTAESLNRVLGLAGESLVETRWIKGFADSLLPLKRVLRESAAATRHLRDTLPAAERDAAEADFVAAERALLECQQLLADRLTDVDQFDRRASSLSRRMYDAALACRMRPFADGVGAFPRVVRDLARSLGKDARLEIVGETTQVDRDILQKLEAPLGHLLRNAVDHGLETPKERLAAGKPAQGVVRLEARHSAGMLQVIVSDDGRGVDAQRVRDAVVRSKIAPADTAHRMTDAEVLEFLFLPGFTLKETVTDISGRGVGLDVVQTMVKEVRGLVRVSADPGHGTRFQLQLPVTLSVVRTLLAEIDGEPYAFPLSSIVRAVRVPHDRIEAAEGRRHFDLNGRAIGLVTAHQVFDIDAPATASGDLAVVVAGDATHMYGLVVDRFLGERELVVQPLDAHLGKMTNIAAGALMEDGSPVLIVDTDDLIRSVERVCAEQPLVSVRGADAAERPAERRRKRVLVVDDSMTVRELERKLLGNLGYDVEVAVNGVDAWNALRTGHFNLVITDVDMPRMDGIELARLVNKDPNLKSVPVMIVSYKDRDEDRRRGLEAGAAYYLTKGSFHDETLAQAVADLIGEATT